MADINVYGTLKTMAEDQKVAYANQVFDEDLNKDQHTINQDLDQKIDDLEFDASDITYDLTATPDLGEGDVQSAIEALDSKVEELKEDVFGDEWENIPYGARRMKFLDKYQLRTDSNGDLTSVSNNICYFYELKGGEEILIQNVGNYGSRYRFYNTFLVSASLNDYVISDTEQIAKGTDTTIKAPTNAKMLVVSEPNAGVINEIVSIRHKGELSIADKTGYKIDTWTDDEIITSTTLAVGSVVPYWSDGTRYGCRGVRLNVKEGDKILLDTYSPALFGLIFTDENRVVKALYDDRRFDGVWTAPVNGYCYIQDVLYRDNFHYSSAHGHLAYMAHDARKRVAKGGDWYNEYAMRRITQVLPYESTFKKTGSATNGWVTQFGVDGTSNLTALTQGRFILCLLKYYVYEDSASSGTIVVNGSNFGTMVLSVDGHYIPGTYQYTYRIYRPTADNAGTYMGAYWYGVPTEPNTHVRFENVFLHSSSDFGELYKLAQKIINGEVEVDNFYGVREKEVDFVKNAIGLQSISDLGYNILEHGATLPIDEEGYKYAKEIYDRYKDNPTAHERDLFRNDAKMVYAPVIHFINETSRTFYQAFKDCNNLVCLPFFDNEDGTYGNLFGVVDGCNCIKKVMGFGELSITSMVASFRYCYALEYIGKLNTHDLTYLNATQTYGSCYSLERIEELDAYSVNANQGQVWNQSPSLRYCLIKNIGHNANNFTNYINFQSNTLYGVPNDKHPDARQSLVDSLLTYSYDRVNDPDGLGTAGTTCTITLSANSYAQLTASEIEQITAKGYTLTHP